MRRNIYPYATMNPLEIVFQDSQLLVVNKPPGLASAPLNKGGIPSACDWVFKQFPQVRELGQAPDFGLLHRLDNETQGLLAFALTPESYSWYGDHWATHVRKWYEAEVSSWEERTLPFSIDYPLAHSAKSSKKVIALRPEDNLSQRRKDQIARGKWHEVKTVVESVEARKTDRHLLKLELVSGFRHQIRCHLAALGSPIVGDKIYGGIEAENLMLKATELRFTSPNNQKKIIISNN